MEPTPMTDFPPPPAYSQSSRKDGYSSLPQHDYGPPTGYSAPAPPHMGYAPAPPVFQQQSSNTNVVVVGNQPEPAPSVVHVQAAPRANDYMACTAIMMVLCILHLNIPALIICIFPAIICSCVAQDHNNAGDYESAKSCGQAALCCNIFSVVWFFLVIIAAVAVVAVYFTVGFAWITNEANSIIHPTSAPVCCGYLIDGYCTNYCS